MWVFAGRASASVCDRPTTRPHWYGPFGPRRADRCDRLLLGSHGDGELLNQLLDRIFTNARPLPRAPKMSVENDTYGITGIPSTVGGRGVVQRAGLAVSTQIIYLGTSHGDM